MTDIVSPATRSRMMSGINAKNSRPEMLVRRLLHSAGFRFRLHRKDLPGTPDIVLPKFKIAIFVNGCFWHSHSECNYAKVPATHSEFWVKKLAANVARDKAAEEKLIATGWRVLCVWECATRCSGAIDDLLSAILKWMNSNERIGEISAMNMPKTPLTLAHHAQSLR
ncbi:MAG: DNA mismatch endonuclease Vsr [Rhodoferax sp.]|nr:DNA mismatch endonuclease Vsr [Rhodoferax sp.]